MSKKILLPVKNNVVVVVPTIDNVLNDGLFVLSSEIQRFKAKIAGGKGLTLDETRQFVHQFKAALDYKNNERKSMDDIANMSDEELYQKAKQLLEQEEIKQLEKKNGKE